MAAVDLGSLLVNLDSDVKTELSSTPEVVEQGDVLDIDSLAVTARRWHRLNDVVAVVADLKNSTKLGTGKWAASTASIYQASTGGVVRIFDTFDADFVAIQGDGAFGLFVGDSRYERAMCAGITITTFSRTMVEKLDQRWDNLPETGLKVGVASSPILVKKVGTPRNHDQQEPIWAGRAVNYAAKAAQGADRHRLAVTASVWRDIAKNDYLAFSCPCNDGPSTRIWSDFTIQNLPEEDPEACGRLLSSPWCATHGTAYCEAVLTGQSSREEVQALRSKEVMAKMSQAIEGRNDLGMKALNARRQGFAR